ncbi:hypothetical protein ACFQ40_04635 [Kroppenstedtia eburnea]|uniref:hypothetical protein n=1 Tax=Kroppenstedtia eburnea TaxID=714067 RepID=UPI003641D7E9
MIDGTFALLLSLSIAVLIQTGWFSGLEQELKWSRQRLVLGLLAVTALLRVEVPVGEALKIQGGMLLLLPFLIRLIRMKRVTLMDLFPAVFLAGSILFFLRELYWWGPAFSENGFRVLGIGAAAGMALLTSRRLHVRLIVAAGGLWLAEWMSLILHRKELNPAVFGVPSALDVFWFTWTAILVSHYALRYASAWVRQLGGADGGR